MARSAYLVCVFHAEAGYISAQVGTTTVCACCSGGHVGVPGDAPGAAGDAQYCRLLRNLHLHRMSNTLLDAFMLVD